MRIAFHDLLMFDILLVRFFFLFFFLVWANSTFSLDTFSVIVYPLLPQMSGTSKVALLKLARKKEKNIYKSFMVLHVVKATAMRFACYFA